MGKTRNKLTIRSIESINKAGRYADGNGLYLVVKGILFGLFGDAAEGVARRFRLDDPGGFAGNEEQIVAGSGRKVKFPDGHAQRRVAIERVTILDDPACIAEQPVNLLARNLLGGRHDGTIKSGAGVVPAVQTAGSIAIPDRPRCYAN